MRSSFAPTIRRHRDKEASFNTSMNDFVVQAVISAIFHRDEHSPHGVSQVLTACAGVSTHVLARGEAAFDSKVPRVRVRMVGFRFRRGRFEEGRPVAAHTKARLTREHLASRPDAWSFLS